MNTHVSLEQTVPGDQAPSLEEAARWLTPGDLAQLTAVMAEAAAQAALHQGGAVELCAIVNARSGRCTEDCAFCAQSAHHHSQAEVYPLMEADAIVTRSRAAAEAGAQRFGIVTSGRDCPDGRALEQILRAVEAIRAEGRVLPCVSLGLLRADQARALADAGTARYHHNLESGPSFFPRICTTHSYQARVDTVLAARDAGLEVCVGGIVGLGESPLERAEFLAAVGALEPESVPLNFLNPIAGTRLGHLEPLSPLEALAAVAVAKIFAPRAAVRTCGGRAQVLGRLASLMYLAGASATMIGDYLTTSGRRPSEDLNDLAALGLTAGLLERNRS